VPTPEQLAGPIGAIIALSAVIVGLLRAVQLLWKDHLGQDHEDRAQRDKALDLLEAALRANHDHAVAQADMAKAWDARNKADAARRRRNDA
jgi:hypothetical protein